MEPHTGNHLLSVVKLSEFMKNYQDLQWKGPFLAYLSMVEQNPKICRSAFQRIYDMIVSFGTTEYSEYKKKITRYKFFDDPIDKGKDAVYGCDIYLMKLVNAFQSAARRYGTEKRILLLHGPVGSAKSTVVRLLKKGAEFYSRKPEGALYSFRWVKKELNDTRNIFGAAQEIRSPMHEDPLLLVPLEARRELLKEINKKLPEDEWIVMDGDLCPASRYIYRELMAHYNGDWEKVMNHVMVERIVLSEQDRIGIGTFQPKDEKNQDSTELTGDINYRKIAEYGSDSDPRAFNFDGEFNIANRGIIEFVEVLKLDVAFLYDLLGASQEHKIKPKKFAQTDIDEVIIGHSVAGDTPIMYRYNETPAWTTLAELTERFGMDATGVEVLAHDFERQHARWTPVRSIFRHRFSGEMLTTSQKWGAVETTPNHSIYDRTGQVFYPESRHEIMAVRKIDDVMAASHGVIDIADGIAGLIDHEVREAVGGGVLTRPSRSGWVRSGLPRHATEIQAVYDPVTDASALKDLLSVLIWYATEGHVNGQNGGVVISQTDPAQLERVRQAYMRISSARGSIDAGAKSDSAWRLTLGADIVATLCRHHCGEKSVNKRLPDFLFRLPGEFLEHAFEELMQTDGSRKVSPGVSGTVSDAYKANFFDYKTISPILAAQVGTIATLLGYDYSVYRHERDGRDPAYRIRFVSGDGKKGGRHKRFEARLHRRPVFGEWVYDIECEGLHNFTCGVGNVVCHNTNEPEYRKLQNNEYMEALRDRTVKVDLPYITKLTEEIKIYEKDYSKDRVRGKHVAPHTLEMAAMWAVLTRLEEPKKAQLTLMQKLKLYDGKTLPGFTEDNVKELRKEARREGMEGISPRYIQDKISNALVNAGETGSINPFMVLNELESGLKHHPLLKSEEQRKRFIELLAVVKEEYEDIVKNEVQRAICADEEAITRLCSNYIDNVKAYTQKERVRNKFTGRDEEPDERLMRSIEEKIDIPESRKDDFRREIMNYIGALSLEGKQFNYKTNERLHKALELKLFEDQKDSIKLTSLVSSVIDKETQEKIDVVKARLIKNYGYNDQSATDVLNYVASIFARGDIKERTHS